MRFENLNDYRYCEVFLISEDPDTKALSAMFYNTTDQNGGKETHDSCPADLWAKVDREALTMEYQLAGVFKNGPRFWMYDWIELPAGTLRDFNGLKAHWMGKVNLPKGFGKEGATYYKPTTVHRKSQQGYKEGQTVFILDDPEGTTWVMQAYSHIIDSSLSYEDLMTLDKKLELPDGWKFRTKKLDQDLTIGAINGLAHVVQDNLESTYNACFEADGQKNCTYVP
ncbi:MAG: hypothetical protein P8Z78_12265 [Gammaproteobacteria bacterium]|jgi:hypothetical protein